MPLLAANLSLPTQAASAPWLSALVAVLLAGTLAPLAGRGAKAVALATRLAATLLAALAFGLVVTRPAHAKLLEATLLSLSDAGAIRLAWSLAVTPSTGAVAVALLGVATLAAWRHRPGGRGLGWTGLVTLSAVAALLAGDSVTFVAALELTGLAMLGLLRTSERSGDVPGAGVRAFGTAALGAASWMAGALLLFWSIGATGWTANGAIRHASGLAILQGLPAAVALSNRRLEAVPLGVEEAMRLGERGAQSVTSVVPGPTFSLSVLRDLVTVESTGLRAHLGAMRVLGHSVVALVTLLLGLGALVASGVLVAGWWGALDSIAPADRWLAALAVSVPPVVMLWRTSFILRESPAAVHALVVVGALSAVVSSAAELPWSWRLLRLAVALAFVELCLVALHAPALAHGGVFLSAALVAFGLPRVRPLATASNVLRTTVVTLVAIVAGIARALGNVAGWIDRRLIDALARWLARPLSTRPSGAPLAPSPPQLSLGASALALSSAALAVVAEPIARPLVVTLAVVGAVSFLRASKLPARVLLAMLAQLAGAMAVVLAHDLRVIAAGFVVAGLAEGLALSRRARGRVLALTVLGAAALAYPLFWLGAHASFDLNAVVALAAKRRWPAGALPACVALAAAFLVRAPLWPLHAPATQAHTESPGPVAMLSAASWLLIEAAGLVRVDLRAFPDEWRRVAPFLALLAVGSLVWQALLLFAERDLKRVAGGVAALFAALLVLAATAGSLAALEAGLEGAVAGALVTALLFGAFEALARRAGHRAIEGFGGLVALLPELAVLSAVGLVAGGGAPLSLAFAATALTLTSSAAVHLSGAFVAVGAMALASGALAWTLDRVYLGPLHEKYRRLEPLTATDRLSLWPLAVALVVLAAFPTALPAGSSASLQAASAATVER